jgi:hypothetical protein
MYYDVNTNQSNLIVENISTPNQKQRKGRVGRSQPGTAYYTYDTTTLESKVIYKLCSDNINDKILDLLSVSKKDAEDKSFKFSDDNNPYLISNEYYTNLDKVPEFLREQYSFTDELFNEKLFYQIKTSNIDYNDIVYPDSDGKYNIETLMDEEGKFYIIHPNEREIDRDMPKSLRILPEKLNELKSNGSYKNKVESIINYLKSLGMMDDNNIVTPYGNLIIGCVQLFEFQTSSIELILTITDLLTFNFSVNAIDNEVFRNIIWYCVFTNSLVKLNLPNDKKVYSDFLGKGNLIPKKLLNLLNLNIISNKLDSELENLSSILDSEINKIITAIPNYKENYDAYKTMLKNYYMIKIQIEILEEIKKGNSTLFFNSPKDLKKGLIYRNAPKIKNIDFTKIPLVVESNINIIKLLNNYEQTCFFICKNMKVKLLLKISGTPYFINYFDRNYRNIYQIKYFTSPYKENKKILITNVYNEYRNNVIFYINSDDDNTITNLMWVPSKVIYIIKKLYKSSIVRNSSFNKEKIMDIYGDNCIKGENAIFKKIDIINDYILIK